MRKIDFANELNSQQFAAVKVYDGPVLVSAGAGSGKTRMLTYRIAYLVDSMGVQPYNILAITFTNKAAAEMKTRIANLIEDADYATICTIHSFCARILRKYCHFVKGYSDNFSIYSESDSNKIFKEIFKSLQIDDEDAMSKIKNNISTIKNEGFELEEFLNIYNHSAKINDTKEVYLQYQQQLLKNNAMDFDDLLVNAYKLLNENEEVLLSVQNKYKYIHIDEFQDTNVVQYKMIRLIALRNQNIFVVGDENQSIYGWRGANPDNMRQFLLDFKTAKVIKLEKNYRSTMPILNSANQLIKHNDNLIEKKLYSEKLQGAEIEYFSAYDEQSEADFVVRKILQLSRMGINYSEMAILMRINALSRPFEEKLLMYNIPHKIYNGFKFYERQEIKNTLAYMVACANEVDDNNLIRIINFPKRGIGTSSIEKLLFLADAHKTSLFNIILNYESYDLPSALKKKLDVFSTLLKNIKQQSVSLPLYEFAEYIISQAGILTSYDLSVDAELERSHNVNSLLQSIKDYSKNNPLATYRDYLETVTLISDIEELEDKNNSVSIASIHGAKGLEFDVVFIVGAEENILPIMRERFDDLQEERRLMYVAITRAKDYLFVTNCKSRFLYGKRERSRPSRFLVEAKIAKEVKIAAYNYENSEYGQINEYKKVIPTHQIQINKLKLETSQIAIGVRVLHTRFGEGTIVNMDKLFLNNNIDIKFDSLGVKTLNIEFAPLQLI